MATGETILQLPVSPAATLADIFPMVQGDITYQETLSQVNDLLGGNIQLASPSQISGLTSLLSGYLPLSGGTLTGNLYLNGNPTQSNQAVNKAYVDAIAGGFKVILVVAAATTANLNATYNNGTAGVGATLTNVGTQVAFAVDGYSASLNDRILVKNQTNQAYNGVYYVSTVGSNSTNWVLTRTTDYDTAADITPGTLVPVENGTVNTNTSWLETATISTIGTDPVIFVQFTAAPNAYFLIANNLSEGMPATMLVNLGLGTPTGTGNVVLQTAPTISNAILNSPKINAIYDQTFGLPVISITGIANAVNYLNVTSSITGNPVQLKSLGTDTNIGIQLITKGNAGVDILGVTSGASAPTGYVGENISSLILFSASITLSNSVAANITSITLDGDFDVYGNVVVTASGVNMTGANGWISKTSATIPDLSTVASVAGGTNAFSNINLVIPSQPINVSTPTNVYLSVKATFSGTCKACGFIYARRKR